MDCIDPTRLEVIKPGTTEDAERAPISDVHCYSHTSAASCSPRCALPENRTVEGYYFRQNTDLFKQILNMDVSATESLCSISFLEEDMLISDEVTASDDAPSPSCEQEAIDDDESLYNPVLVSNSFSPNKELRELKYDLKVVQKCLLSIQDVKDALVKLYFSHVHPFLPVVDEYSFMLQYDNCKNDNHFMKSTDVILLLAVFFAGFGHVSEDHLRRSAYKSVHEGQKGLFRTLKYLYHLRITTDPYTLCQVSIILSLWSPCDSESQVNSLWIARAFDHAREDSLLPSSKKVDYGTLRCRRNIIQWCCLIRERMLALGMRRPQRLHKSNAKTPLLNERDFGLEVMFPRYVSVAGKKGQVVLFIMLCKLSNIMEDIAVFQRTVKFSDAWDNDENVGPQEIESVVVFDQALKSWRRDLDNIIVGGDKQRYEPDERAMVYVLQIMSNSLLAVLYRPYLCSSTRSPSLSPNFMPLQQVKSSSQALKQSLEMLLETSRLEGIPSYLVSWLALPTALDYVAQYLFGSSSGNNKLKSFLISLRSRYQSAQFVTMLLDQAVKQLPKDNHEASFFKLIYYALQEPAQENLYICDLESEEAEALHHVVSLVDLGLGNDIRGMKTAECEDLLLECW